MRKKANLFVIFLKENWIFIVIISALLTFGFEVRSFIKLSEKFQESSDKKFEKVLAKLDENQRISTEKFEKVLAKLDENQRISNEKFEKSNEKFEKSNEKFEKLLIRLIQNQSSQNQSEQNQLEQNQS